MSDKYDDMIRSALKKAQAKYGYGSGAECFAIVKAVIETESNFNPDAENSTTHARGLMQLLRAAAKDMGYDYDSLWDPATNIECGTLYLAWCIKQRGGDCWQGVAGYKAGVGNVKKAGGDIEKMDEETQQYVSLVRKRREKYGKDDKKPAGGKTGGAAKTAEAGNVDDELERIRKKTEILERLKKLAEGDWKEKLQPSIDALIKELEREIKSLGAPPAGTTPGTTPSGVEKGEGKPGGDKGATPGGDKKEGKDEEDEEYVVVDGDTLWKIAKKLLKEKTGADPTDSDVDKAIKKIQDANPGVDPKKLRPGKKLKIPPL